MPVCFAPQPAPMFACQQRYPLRTDTRCIFFLALSLPKVEVRPEFQERDPSLKLDGNYFYLR